MSASITVPQFIAKKQRGEKIVMITCYDYPSARLMDGVGVDAFLVGDSLGDNVLGYADTIPVTLDEMIHHARAVRRGTAQTMLVVDMPFMSYQINAEDALRNAGRVMKETGAEAVKLEGGMHIAPTVERLVAAGIPVMGHIGLTPQSVNVFGGYRIQGKDPGGAQRLLDDALALESAGAFSVVLELVQPGVARHVSESISIPTIGIGAGGHCDGQIQVFHDLFGLNPDRRLKHVRRYAEVGEAIREASARYADEVRNGVFPALESLNGER